MQIKVGGRICAVL